MAQIGILFDIGALEGEPYGYAAYAIFFRVVDSRHLAGCLLKDGDTNDTLQGKANYYCIAVECSGAAQVAAIEDALGNCGEKGLLPLESRFIHDDAVTAEPLVIAANIDENAALTNCQTSWILSA